MICNISVFRGFKTVIGTLGMNIALLISLLIVLFRIRGAEWPDSDSDHSLGKFLIWVHSLLAFIQYAFEKSSPENYVLVQQLLQMGIMFQVIAISMICQRLYKRD